MMDRMGHKEGEVIQHSMISKSIERAQKKVEENNFGIRKRLLEYDDVMSAQREVIYKRRYNALFGDRLKVDIANMIYDTTEIIVENNKLENDYKNSDELIALIERVKSLSEINTDESNKQEPPDESVLRISKHQGSLVQELYELECVKVKDRTSWKSQLYRWKENS